MQNINIIITNKTSMTMCIKLNHKQIMLSHNEKIIMPISQYIARMKRISPIYFQIKIDCEYKDILKQINNITSNDIKHYIFLNNGLNEIEKNTLLLIKEIL